MYSLNRPIEHDVVQRRPSSHFHSLERLMRWVLVTWGQRFVGNLFTECERRMYDSTGKESK